MLKLDDDDPQYTVQRTYRTIDAEVFYFNNTLSGAGNCDRQGPLIRDPPASTGAFHQIVGNDVQFQIRAVDLDESGNELADPSEVWRIVLVHDDGTTAPQFIQNVGTAQVGRWSSLDLVHDGQGNWTGTIPGGLAGSGRLTYVIQAVDRRGNVSVKAFSAAQPPSSGAVVDIPDPIDVDKSKPLDPNLIFEDGFESGGLLNWLRHP